jgi:hypothetical protein
LWTGWFSFKDTAALNSTVTGIYGTIVFVITLFLVDESHPLPGRQYLVVQLSDLPQFKELVVHFPKVQE